MSFNKQLKSFFLIVNYKSILLSIVALTSTYICNHYNWTADFPVILVTTAIVFPLVFSIDSAFKRRESALRHLADFRSHGLALYYATRDWGTQPNAELIQRTKNLMLGMVADIRMMLKEKDKAKEQAIEEDIYQRFSALSSCTMELRQCGVQSGEISRASQYVSKMLIAFDNLKLIHHYRTPITLRAYSRVFIYLFPVIYGPAFAYMFKDNVSLLEYVMPVMYSFVLVSLSNIQDHLEHPFDEEGEDDVIISEKDMERMMA